jgi:putative ABC transport system ATP-binding protein
LLQGQPLPLWKIFFPWFFSYLERYFLYKFYSYYHSISSNPLDPEETLKEVGLSHRLNNFPSQLSGGEQQRVAIARALAKNPKLLLCDEPTGALDYETGKNILKLLEKACHEMGATVVIITHNSLIKPMADQVIEIRDGKIVEDYINNNPLPVDEIEW